MKILRIITYYKTNKVLVSTQKIKWLWAKNFQFRGIYNVNEKTLLSVNSYWKLLRKPGNLSLKIFSNTYYSDMI